jgi:dUTP pyrophosphatase
MMTPYIVVKLKKVQPDVPDPVYGTKGSAGCDVHANEDVDIPKGERRLIKTGLLMEIPHGYECQIRPRSGLALKNGVVVFNTPSTIDSDYRGEVGVLLVNTSKTKFQVTRGMRIAQLVFAPVTVAKFETVDELGDSARGTGGWGSTGVK